MSDDMLGLFDSMLEAYLSGKQDGKNDAFKMAIFIASCVGSECESSCDDHGFHVAEKIVSKIKNRGS